MPTKQVIVIRKDLNMRKGKMVAQGAHASMKAILDAGETEEFDVWGDGSTTHTFTVHMTPTMADWITGTFTKVCVSVGSEEELLNIYKQSEEADLPCSLIQDIGLTEFDGVPTYTAVAVGPGDEAEINKITGELKLL